jgi:hypothetical protein
VDFPLLSVFSPILCHRPSRILGSVELQFMRGILSLSEYSGVVEPDIAPEKFRVSKHRIVPLTL